MKLKRQNTNSFNQGGRYTEVCSHFLYFSEHLHFTKDKTVKESYFALAPDSMYRVIKEQVQVFCTSTNGPRMAPDCQLLPQRAWRSCSLSVRKELSGIPLGETWPQLLGSKSLTRREAIQKSESFPANLGTKEPDKWDAPAKSCASGYESKYRAPMLMHQGGTGGCKRWAKSLTLRYRQVYLLNCSGAVTEFPGGLLTGDRSNQVTSQFPVLCLNHGPSHSSS